MDGKSEEKVAGESKRKTRQDSNDTKQKTKQDEGNKTNKKETMIAPNGRKATEAASADKMVPSKERQKRPRKTKEDITTNMGNETPKDQQITPRRIKGFVKRVRLSDGFSETFTVKKRASEEGVNPETIRKRARSHTTMDGWRWSVAEDSDQRPPPPDEPELESEVVNEGTEDVGHLRTEVNKLKKALNTAVMEKKEVEERNRNLENELSKYILSEKSNLKVRSWKAKKALDNAMTLLKQAIDTLPQNEDDN
eukprot:m.22158 g.22158  ORF g.22158 m.22158 type:complete len:252 (-) comp7358_c0_seq1:169-924(-)